MSPTNMLLSTEESNEIIKRIDNIVAFLKKYIDFFSEPFENQEQFATWVHTHNNATYRELNQRLVLALQEHPYFFWKARSLLGQAICGQKRMFEASPNLWKTVIPASLKTGDESKIRNILEPYISTTETYRVMNDLLLDALEGFAQNEAIITDWRKYKEQCESEPVMLKRLSL